MDDNMNQGNQGETGAGGAPKPSFDSQQIVAYLKGLADKALAFLTPDKTWDRIAAEEGDAFALYRSWVLPMAAIPAFFLFLGMLFAGARIADSFFTSVLIYILILVGIPAFAFFLQQVAPKVEASITFSNALKLGAYALTPAFAGGFLLLLYYLNMLFEVLYWVLSLGSIYLLWVGLPKLAVVSEANKPKFFGIALAGALCILIVLALILSVR